MTIQLFRCFITTAFVATSTAFAPDNKVQLLKSKSLTGSVPNLHPAITAGSDKGITDNTVVRRVDDVKFDWDKAWYPLVPVKILDREKPHRFELLGESVVVWNDGPVDNGGGLFRSKKSRPKKSKRTEGTWRAFVDECPHRKVPLSEGRVEDDGTLLCSYHAWRFDGEGACVNVPQLDNTSLEYNRIMNNPKSSCNSYPTKVVDGLLFVWPSSDKDAVLQSELTPIPLPSPMTNDVDGINRSQNKTQPAPWYSAWNFRELPYGVDYFLENAVDPAHVMVSHHNVVGNRYKIEPMSLRLTTSLSKSGFVFQQMKTERSPGITTAFIAPALVTMDVAMNGSKQRLELYASPSRPGFCNHISRIVSLKNDKGERQRLLRPPNTPSWLNHVLSSSFWNQDALFLHHQERHLAKTGQYSTAIPIGSTESGVNGETSAYQYNRAVQASPSDLGVITFRNWIRVFAGSRIPYRNHQTTMPPASNDIVFDVWNAHTKYCKYCQDALQRLKVIRFITYSISATLAITRPFNGMGTLFASFTFAGIGLLLSKLIGLFYRFEYSHAHND